MNFLKLITALAVLAFCSCDFVTSYTKPAEVTTIKRYTIVYKKIPKPYYVNEKFDAIARYIAGKKPLTEGVPEVLLNNLSWKSFSEEFTKSWTKYDSTRLSIMRSWRNEQLTVCDNDSSILFYPFAGADALNAYTLFPKVTKYILVGLEPIGSLPSFNEEYGSAKAVASKTNPPQESIKKTMVYEEPKSNIASYFNALNISLNSILNNSFFRTISMQSDFRREELNGTLHPLLLFIVRTDNRIANIRYIGLDNKSQIKYFIDYTSLKNDTLKNKGVEIQFFTADSSLKTLQYFSVNLGDEPLKANPVFKNYISSHKNINSYIKSASYLMHRPYFGEIRDLILNNSNCVLEDDSGIPWRFFDQSVWEITLYGVYTGTIPMFSSNNTQKDLMEAYRDSSSSNTKKLPFGIGYKYVSGQSNLLLAVRKKNL